MSFHLYLIWLHKVFRHAIFMSFLHFKKLVQQVVKIADFGVARLLDQSTIMTAETGTYRWMAPEVDVSIVLITSI